MWRHLAGQVERCDECRFDGSAYTVDDVSGTLRNLAEWAGHAMGGIEPTDLNRRPTPTTWSPAEYLRHTKRVVWSMAGLAEMALAESGLAVAGSPPDNASADDPPAIADVYREFVRLDEEAQRLHLLWATASADERARTIDINGSTADVAGIVRHAVHDATHHLADIGRGIVALGLGTPDAVGCVDLIHASGGGVPKLTVPQAIVGYRGVGGDRQATRKHHGRVWQAICLWSTEVIDTLAAEGHPVAPGFAGENFTLSGIDWATLRPGARLEIGGRDGVVLETTAWATPCKTLNDVFTNRDFRRIDVLRDPGASRLYAKVLRDGVVRAGDPVRVH